MISDEALYHRLLQGDEGALEALVHRYHGQVVRFLHRQTGDRHLAEDLTQEAFTRLVTYRGEPPRSFRPWAYAIVANLARDHFRSAYHRREQAQELSPWVETALHAANPGADDLLLRDADRLEVVQALQALSPEQREVVVLRFYHDLKLEEIAEVTAAPLGTVKSRLFHALRHLKADLQEGGNRHVGAQ